MENGSVKMSFFEVDTGKERCCPNCCDMTDEMMDLDIIEFDVPTLQKAPEFPDFYTETLRLQTFEMWPKTLKQTPQELAAAGFFYTQKDDRVICFCCGGGLHSWEEKDDPWEQHVWHYGECEYSKLTKGAAYITSIKEKIENILTII